MPRISSKPKIVFKQQISKEVHCRIKVSKEIRDLIREDLIGDGTLNILFASHNSLIAKLRSGKTVTIPCEKEVARAGKGAHDVWVEMDRGYIDVTFGWFGRDRILKLGKAL